jgi:hypothetical protein
MNVEPVSKAFNTCKREVEFAALKPKHVGPMYAE